MTDHQDTVLRGDSGVLLRVDNGTVIAYDSTGLILRLSDKVVDDLRARLGPLNAPGASAEWIAPEVLGDIDAWNVARHGDWYHFDAKLPTYPHPRRFRRPVSGGHIVAEAAGPLMAVLSIGGARRAWAVPGRAAFPAHVVCPADDIGPVGVAGTEAAVATDGLEQAREVTLDTLLADALLANRQREGRALPLIMALCETDCAGSAADLADGIAMANLEQAIANTISAAARLGTSARILAVALDFGAEDVCSDHDTYIAGMRTVMDRIAAKLGADGMHEPVFVMRSDETGARVHEHWHLSVFPGAHKLVFAAPGYAFEFDDNFRPTAQAMAQMAAAEAAAINATLQREPWHCPRVLLAETMAPGQIRVTTDALTPLVLDHGAFGTGADHGFSLGGVEITEIARDPGDDRALILHHGAGAPSTLSYAAGRAGALRDDTGRWALPAILTVGQC
ncbi:hypothetical protein [Oceaniglobus ichthyenteri]|uniref:hypothetical protein n=1 Tax=Oceaniglobus ichthyenteri TaxID=2136177 RepID=UPI000F84A628|nr:hypothetical protein [Oceaniglobus ichthyenteri]